MEHNSSDYNIKPFEFKDSARIQETGELDINLISSFENEDCRAKSLVGMMGEVSEKRNFMSYQLGETEESFAKLSLERMGEKTGDNCVSRTQQSRFEGCDSEFLVNTTTEVAEKAGDSNEYDSAPLFEVANEHNDKNRGPMAHQSLKPVETDSLLPQLMDNNDKKGRFLSLQMPKSENIDSESPLYIREENNRKYGSGDAQGFEVNGLESNSPSSTSVANDHLQNSSRGDYQRRSLVNQQFTGTKNSETKSPTGIMERSCEEKDANIFQEKQGQYFYYDSPLYEETGIWIPVSIPPMSESEHQEWTRGFCSNGGYEGDEGWGLCLGKEKELTMWDVVLEMLLVAKGKVNALASGDIPDISWISGQLIEQAWKEMAQTLSESSLSNVQEILESEPPKWLPDSTASTCMLCSVRFHPIMCTRHHCRFCGGIFCSDCTRGRSLLPEKFRTANPQRVCDVCCVRLESVQPYLMDQVSRAAQLPTHDLTDLSTLRSWMNFPWGQSMEYEIYKATNTIRGYSKVGSLKPEKRIPEAILRNAKGLAILTIAKVGVMVTYNIGTGLVIACREDGSWSPPSAVSSFGVGWGAQAGGELIDLIIVLRTDDAIRTFSGNTHLSVGAGLSAAIGIIGRTAEADLRAGTSGYAACYTYSCSKGAFIGCSLEGSIVVTRAQENSRFYGSQSITASDILLGSLPRPPAASILYRALADLYEKL